MDMASPTPPSCADRWQSSSLLQTIRRKHPGLPVTTAAALLHFYKALLTQSADKNEESAALKATSGATPELGRSNRAQALLSRFALRDTLCESAPLRPQLSS